MYIASPLPWVHLPSSKNSSRIFFDLSTNLTQMESCSTWWPSSLSTRMIESLAFFTSSIRSLCIRHKLLYRLFRSEFENYKYCAFLAIGLSKCSLSVWSVLPSSLNIAKKISEFVWVVFSRCALSGRHYNNPHVIITSITHLKISVLFSNFPNFRYQTKKVRLNQDY